MNKDILFVRTKNPSRLHKFNLCDILLIRSANDSVKVYSSVKGICKVYQVDLTMTKMESMLPKDDFSRIHRQTIIRIDKITCIEDYHITMDDLLCEKIEDNPGKITISDFFRKSFFEKIGAAVRK